MKLILMAVAAGLLAAWPALAQDPAPQPEANPVRGDEQPPKEEAPAMPKTYKVVKHDCLWEIAKTFYKNPYRWKVIYAANRDKIKDPNLIYPGQVLNLSEAPAPEIGEVGARPVQASAEIKVPQEEPPAAPALAPAPAAEPAPAPAPPPSSETKEDLRDKIPKGITGQYPMMPRLVRPADWRADGKVMDPGWNPATPAQGDVVQIILSDKATAAVGDRFTVYRRDAPLMTEEDKKATYLTFVGTVQVQKALDKKTYAVVILQSADTLQDGDLIKKEGL